MLAHILRIISIALACIGVVGCASSGPIGLDPAVEVAPMGELPPPGVDEASTILPQDKLRVDVLGFDELSRELQVSAAGTFPFPLIGVVEAAGKEPTAVAQDIANRLRGRYVVNPIVTVDVLEQPNRLITVGGEVEKPGRYPVLGKLSLLEAVASAEGTTDSSKLKEVMIFREVAGQRYIGIYDLRAIQRGNYRDPRVFPGDIIQVGRSPTLRYLQAIAAITPLITTPIILLDRARSR